MDSHRNTGADQRRSHEPEYLVRTIKVDPAVYRTDIPLIVVERCRDPGPGEDGGKLDFKTLLAVWYGLRWLMAAFPHRRGFGQRVISEVAGVDQKYIHKYLRAHRRLETVAEVGRERYEHLTGSDGRPKEQPVYSIPLDDLDRESSARAAALIVAWDRRLFGGELRAGPAPIEAQLALDLDVEHDPPPGPPPGMRTSAPDPLRDQETLIRGSRMHAPAVCPSVSQSEGATFGRSAPPDSAQPEPLTPLVPPPPPSGERPLAQHPLTFLHSQREPGADAPTFALLAAEHDAPTGGHGWYWLGRAIDAGLVAQGGIEHVRDLYRLTRSVLDSWRKRETYGAPPPTSPRPPRPGPRPHPSQAVPPVGERVSDIAILRAPHLTVNQRQIWLGRFRAAPDAAAKRAVLERFATEAPPPDEAAA